MGRWFEWEIWFQREDGGAEGERDEEGEEEAGDGRVSESGGGDHVEVFVFVLRCACFESWPLLEFFRYGSNPRIETEHIYSEH